MDHTRSNFDAHGATVTADGRRWELSIRWDANWSVDTATGTEVLGLGQRGLAAARIKRQGGPPGTGFLRINGGSVDAGPTANFAEIQAVAECLPQDLKSAR